MGLTPGYRLRANTQDVTERIAQRFRGLRLTDAAGTQADTLEIVLADHDPAQRVQMPATGAELELWLGYDDKAQRMGLFVVDEIELSGPPDEMVIRARAAPYEASTGGKSDLQTQRDRSWPDGTKLGDMVKTIAKAHKLAPAVSASIAATVLPHFDQTAESDISFLLRVCRKYDCTVKPAGGRLVVTKRGEGTTASGGPLPSVTVRQQDCSRWRMVLARRESPGTVVAFWHAVKAGKRKEITVGSGDPVKQLRHHFPTEAAAMAAATAELDRRKRGEETLSISMPGDPRLQAECRLTAEGFRDGVAGDWLVARVVHTLDVNGYRCDVDCEKPND